MTEEQKTIKVPVSVWKQAKIEATKHNMTIAQFTTNALNIYKERLDKETKE